MNLDEIEIKELSWKPIQLLTPEEIQHLEKEMELYKKQVRILENKLSQMDNQK
jgi:hypothetical protein